MRLPNLPVQIVCQFKYASGLADAVVRTVRSRLIHFQSRVWMPRRALPDEQRRRRPGCWCLSVPEVTGLAWLVRHNLDVNLTGKKIKWSAEQFSLASFLREASPKLRYRPSQAVSCQYMCKRARTPPPRGEGSGQDADLCQQLPPFLLLYLRKFHQDISHHLDCFFEIFSVFALLFSTLCHLFL